MPYKNFGAETLTAADVNNYLMRQTVIRVANPTELAAVPAPELGMLAHQESPAGYRQFDGTDWVPMRAGLSYFFGSTIASDGGAIASDPWVYSLGTVISPTSRVRVLLSGALNSTAAGTRYDLSVRSARSDGPVLGPTLRTVPTAAGAAGQANGTAVGTAALLPGVATALYLYASRVSGSGTGNIRSGFYVELMSIPD